MNYLKCNFCKTPLKHAFADLGVTPISNDYLKLDDLNKVERFYPLCAYVCEACHLVQLPEIKSPEEIFGDYAYFSSYSDSYVKHAGDYVDMMVRRFDFNGTSLAIEIASNDGYLLQHFKERGVPIQGIEPAENVAKVAVEKGIPTLVEFFGVGTARRLADKKQLADVLLGNNVLAHVPDINDFVGGMKILLKPHGVITMEFPHLMQLMEHNQFDTIYHEHFSYLSFITVERIFAHHGLTLFDVEEVWTHGGSLRIFARHNEDDSKSITDRVNELRRREEKAGFASLGHYLSFQEQINKTKRKLLTFLIQAKEQGKVVAAYGAPAKGNTLLNYCGIRSDFIEYTVDRSPHKQGQYLPGTRIPIYAPEKILNTRPDYVLILPWNFKDEIMEQMSEVRTWGGKFIVPIPDVEIYT